MPTGTGKGTGPHSCPLPILIILDPTRDQFKDEPPYQEGRGRGFLTKGPSKRAREMMERMLWQDP